MTKIRELSDGRIIAIKHQPMPDEGWLSTHEDMTEYRRIEARVAHMAHHDILTELPNRTLLRERHGAGARWRCKRAGAWRCSASTSTASRTSTIRSATQSAMPC